MPAPLAQLQQARRFATGLRTFLHAPIPLEEAQTALAHRWRGREQRFLERMRDLVWANAASPYRPLLDHAGIEPGDVEALVRGRGLVGALETLRDAGVYVSYEEYGGGVPARRGSLELHLGPEQFLNPAVRADYMGSSSGTRSEGRPVGKSFEHLRAVATGDLVHRSVWGATGAPHAVWLPVLPSSAGLNNVLRASATGDVPERWFSHVHPREAGITTQKRMANRALPVLARLFRTAMPRPEHAPDPEPVLEWCLDALGREVWRRGVDSPPGPITMDAEDTALLVSARGTLYAMDRKGELRYRRSLDSGATGRPVVGPDQTLYMTFRSGRIEAFK